MIAPGYKKSRIIQIDVTNRCDLRCSNCTRMLAHHPTRYDMSPAVFRETCRVLNAALPDFVKGLFGGNPALHPEFDKLCAIMREEIPDQHRRGLWCNHLRGHGPVARETFWPDAYFNLNAHTIPGAVAEFEKWLPGKIIPESRHKRALHSPTMVAIKDFVGTPEIPDDAAMWKKIDGCDINREWSGIVIEHAGAPYLYACEIHGAFDLVSGENNGVRLTVESARACVERFEHQYRRWCPGCGIALRLRGHQDLDETDDVSPSNLGLIHPTRRRLTVLHENLEAPRCEVATDYERRVSS